MKKFVITALCLSVISFAHAQNKQEIAAFSNSYAMEAKEDYANAIKALEVLASATDFGLNLRLGWLYYMSGNQDQSLKYYQTALALQPKSIQARFGLAYPLAALKQWDKLATNYDDLLKVSPNNTTALYRLALMYYNLANFEKAEQYLKQLVQVNSFDYSTSLLMGWNSLKLGKYKDAEIWLNVALCLKPDDQSALDGMKLLKK